MSSEAAPFVSRVTRIYGFGGETGVSSTRDDWHAVSGSKSSSHNILVNPVNMLSFITIDPPFKPSLMTRVIARSTCIRRCPLTCLGVTLSASLNWLCQQP